MGLLCMNLTIDDIYDLFTWDASFSDEEYNARVQQGISEARKLRNLYPFIQPIVAGGNSKSVWGPCAMVIALKPDEELEGYLHLLLKWLRDMNWPGAEIIFDRLSKIPVEIMEESLAFSILCAKQEKDRSWLNTLDALKEHRNWY